MSAIVSNEGRDALLEGVGTVPLLARTRTTSDNPTVKEEFYELTRSDIVIIIHLSNGKKSRLAMTRADLFNDRFQPSVSGNKMYKIAQYSDVNQFVPNFFPIIHS